MTSKEVSEYLKDEQGVARLYKWAMRYFDLVDKWSETFTNSNLLNEYDLSLGMDQLSGVYAKLNPIAGALEAIKLEKEHGREVLEYDKLEKVKTQDGSVVRAKARDSVSQIRKYTSDFSSYCQSAQGLIITSQSRLKRLTVEKGAKKVDYTGEVPVNGTGAKPSSQWE